MRAALKKKKKKNSHQSHPYSVMLQTVMTKEIVLHLECVRIILVEMV